MPEPLSSKDLYIRLLRHVRPYWKVFALSIAGMAVVAATEPVVPALMKPVLDGTFVHRDEAIMRMTPFILVGLAVVRGLAWFIGAYSINWVGNRIVLDLREAMFRQLISLPARHYDEAATGVLISKVTFDVTQVTQAATNALTAAVKDVLTIVGLLGWLFYLNWKLTLLALVMAPLISLIVMYISRRLRRASREAQRAMGDITQVLQEAIDGHKVVKLFGGQAYEAARFHDEANRVRHFTMKQATAASMTVPLVQLVAAVALAAILYVAMVQSAADETTVGGFVSFIMAMLMLTAPVKKLTGVNEHIQRGLAAAESVFALIDQVPERDTGTVEIPRARGEIRFEGVGMTYPGASRRALDGIELAVAPGETVALVGPSGSGKTTLANLVPRFYHPGQGRILLDGHDLETLRLASLRANIALVSQEVVLFNDTVAANIAYGALDRVPREKILEAAEAAHAMEFIREMPQGLDTLVGEKGLKLSGGQRQRMAIARALLKDAPILILDEATSALDSESERHVQAALEVLMRGRTTLVVAHRLSTIEKADRIVVLDRGRIAEVGTHAELLRQGGIYARLHRIQFQRVDDAAGEGGA